MFEEFGVEDGGPSEDTGESAVEDDLADWRSGQGEAVEECSGGCERE